MEGGGDHLKRRRSNSLERKTRRMSKESSRGSRRLLQLVVLVGSLLLFAYFLPKNPLSRVVISSVNGGLGIANLADRKHAVVIDAGSTGSRVLAFSFQTDAFTKELVLTDELWHQEKPGLSSYADEPAKGGESIMKLIDTAKERIPEKYWSTTPITLKATAGLRLLPTEKAEALLQNVKTVLDQSGFIQLIDDPGVEIMSDLNEGIFGWVTINYLLGRMSDPENSAVALDLGGGSTQITFKPNDASTLEASPVDFLQDYENSKLYTHSYLGLGLMSARREILQFNGEESGEVSSPCFTKEVKWTHQQTEFNVTPKDQGFRACKTLVKDVIDTKGVDSPTELGQRDIVAFSYFFDRALEAGLVGDSGGYVAVNQLKKAAEAACGSTESSFECIDLTYIYALLKKYGLDDRTSVGLFKKIDGHETSWALGCALNLLSQ